MPQARALWLRFLTPIVTIIGVGLVIVTVFQVRIDRRNALDDLERRARVVATALMPLAEQNLRPTSIDPAILANRFERNARTLGVLLCRQGGSVAARSPEVAGIRSCSSRELALALEGRHPAPAMIDSAGAKVLLYAEPVIAGGRVKGALAVFHDASYIDRRIMSRVTWAAMILAGLALLTSLTTLGSAYTVFGRSFGALAGWMRRLRLDESLEEPPPAVPLPGLAAESERLAASFRAARSSARTQARTVTEADRAWTSERLRHHVIDALNGAQLVVVSNREPYLHFRDEQAVQWLTPASGLVTALDPVLRATGGLWVAHGAGEADRETADRDGHLVVPPGAGRYTLRRVWISRDEERGYYYGFSNEALWPLCHGIHERPVYRSEDWAQYKTVNERFARAVLDEIGDSRAVVLVQDYHLALLPKLLRAERPDLVTSIFWHIPWPSAEAFSTCPWKAELLDGMLAADLVGFHLQQYCNNFLETVDRTLEVRVDLERFGVWRADRMTQVRALPISIQSWQERGAPSEDAVAQEMARLRDAHQLGDAMVAIGVDRIDPTKGIPDRIRAVERFLELNPSWIGRFCFVELGAPSRLHLKRYRDLGTEVQALADEVNWKFGTEGWKPIHILEAHHPPETVYAWMRLAGVCIVSSLSDGLNLVAKEFVAAREDGDGVLILSEFTGSARELRDALLVNPYHVEEFAAAIRRALDMSPGERRERMSRLRAQVSRFNVYRWARDLIDWTARSASRTGPEVARAQPPDPAVPRAPAALGHASASPSVPVRS